MTETWYREELTKLAGELMQITNLDRTKVRRRRVEVNEISEKGHGNQGSAFGRAWLTPGRPEAKMKNKAQ